MDTQEDKDKKNEKKEIHNMFNKIEQHIKCGSLEKFKQVIEAMNNVQETTLLNSCYINRDVNLISLICKHSNKKILKYLLHESHILDHLSSNDESKEIKAKETAFYYAMRSNNVDILEILYDYWSGDLHWLGHIKEYYTFDVNNLNQLNELLKNSFDKYEQRIQVKGKVDQLMLDNIKSLMAYNAFQRNIYTKLNDFKATLIPWEDEPEDIIRRQETYAIRSMILAVIDMYEKYSKKLFNENEINDFADEEQNDSWKWETDVGTTIQKTCDYVTYEMFYRKIDSNVCLLILDNLHLLKLRLSMPQNSYQRLEDKLYHFYYHVSNKWSLYFPRKKKMESENILGKYKDISCCFTFNYDANKWNNFPQFMYLERRDFEKTIRNFNDELKTINIEKHIRNKKNKLPDEDHNYLVLVPELRDDYSLKVMSQLIGQLYSVNVNKEYMILLLERTLQIVGELLKSTNESLHLEPCTQALLKAETSVEVVNDLKKLRNMLGHTKNSMLLKRIELEKNKCDISETTRKELLHIKTKIDKIIYVHKPLVHRALLLTTKSILCKLRNDMPPVVATLIVIILKLLTHFDSNQFYEQIWIPLSCLKSVAKEVIMLILMFVHVEIKLKRVNETICNNIIRNFTFYREIIEYSINSITLCKSNWQTIVTEIKDKHPSTVLLDYPNEKDDNIIKLYAKNVSLDEDTTSFASIKHHWKFIINLLEFIVVKTSIFNNDIEDLNLKTRLEEIEKYEYRTNNPSAIVTEYLDKIKTRLEIINGTNTIWPTRGAQPQKFDGIREFKNKLLKLNFLTEEEKIYLIDYLQNISPNSAKQRSNKDKMIEKIEKDIAIPMINYRNFVNSMKLDEKAQKVLKNLVMGHARDPLTVRCLSNRISLLKEITKKHTGGQLVLRYKSDKIFRVLLEILLFDIFDILEENNKNTAIVKKYSNLLMEINLRNILIHGSPLLEVLGVILDCNDLPTELVTKAIDFVNDKMSIEALCALNDLGFFSQENDNKISTDEQAWMIEFKKSPRWKDYIRLIPEFKQKEYENRKKTPAIVNKTIELLNAVHRKDYLLVDECIVEGGDVNFIDKHKRAPIHYAAMRGDLLVMSILVNNQADINIQNAENNLTALHYSAMYNYETCVKYLLKQKANCHAVDKKGRTPVYLANIRNFSNISRILLREMRKIEMIE